MQSFVSIGPLIKEDIEYKQILCCDQCWVYYSNKVMYYTYYTELTQTS